MVRVSPVEGDMEKTASVFVKALLRSPKVMAFFASQKAFDVKYRLQDFAKVLLPSWLRGVEDPSEDAVSGEILTYVPAFKNRLR